MGYGFADQMLGLVGPAQGYTLSAADSGTQSSFTTALNFNNGNGTVANPSGDKGVHPFNTGAFTRLWGGIVPIFGILRILNRKIVS